MDMVVVPEKGNRNCPELRNTPCGPSEGAGNAAIGILLMNITPRSVSLVLKRASPPARTVASLDPAPSLCPSAPVNENSAEAGRERRS